MTRCWVMAIWRFSHLGRRTETGHGCDFIFCPMLLCSALDRQKNYHIKPNTRYPYWLNFLQSLIHAAQEDNKKTYPVGLTLHNAIGWEIDFLQINFWLFFCVCYSYVVCFYSLTSNSRMVNKFFLKKSCLNNNSQTLTCWKLETGNSGKNWSVKRKSSYRAVWTEQNDRSIGLH